MPSKLTNAARALLGRPVIATVATVDAEDRPQITPVWIDVDVDDIVFNTARGRAKDVNLTRNPSVAVCVVDPDNPYSAVVVRGRAEGTEEGADAQIDVLAKKYMGVDRYPLRQPDEVRVTYRVRPETIVVQPEDS